MNQEQLMSLLRALLAAGGPVAGLLANFGMQPGTVTNVLTIALIVLPPLISAVWGYLDHTDRAKIASAASVEGVTKIKIDPYATGGAAAAAADPALANVKKGV